MSRPSRSRRKPPAPRWAGQSLYIAEQLEAESYTSRWHRVRDWALEALEPADIRRIEARGPYANRIETYRGQMVRDLLDDEEAYDRGTPLEALEIMPGPVGQYHDAKKLGGGRRRVMIRLFTWAVDRDNPIAYSPQWIVAGHGMSALAASSGLQRYVRSYALAVSKGIESRRLTVTAIDVGWWTANEGADYV